VWPVSVATGECSADIVPSGSWIWNSSAAAGLAASRIAKNSHLHARNQIIVSVKISTGNRWWLLYREFLKWIAWQFSDWFLDIKLQNQSRNKSWGMRQWHNQAIRPYTITRSRSTVSPVTVSSRLPLNRLPRLMRSNLPRALLRTYPIPKPDSGGWDSYS